VFTWFGVFCQIFPDILDRYSQSFHHKKTLYVQKIDPKFLFQYLKGRCHGNQIIYERQVQHGQKTGIFCQICPDLLDRFLQSFHHMKALDVQMMDLYLFSQFGEIPSSNLGVYAVKTRNFCRHVPAILERSSHVTLAFLNGLEDRNFDFSRVIGKHFCTLCRNLARFGSVTPEFKT